MLSVYQEAEDDECSNQAPKLTAAGTVSTTCSAWHMKYLLTETRDCPINAMQIPSSGDPSSLMDRYAKTIDQSKNTFSEDCLSLNIWTKPQTGDAKKAVMIWIYGGGEFLMLMASTQLTGIHRFHHWVVSPA